MHDTQASAYYGLARASKRAFYRLMRLFFNSFCRHADYLRAKNNFEK